MSLWCTIDCLKSMFDKAMRTNSEAANCFWEIHAGGQKKMRKVYSRCHPTPRLTKISWISDSQTRANVAQVNSGFSIWPEKNFWHEMWLTHFFHMLSCRCNFCLAPLKSGRSYGPLIFATKVLCRRWKGGGLDCTNVLIRNESRQCWVLGLINIPGPFHCFWAQLPGNVNHQMLKSWCRYATFQVCNRTLSARCWNTIQWADRCFLSFFIPFSDGQEWFEMICCGSQP